MCLIVLAWQAHPDYPLVVAANRDEFRDRAALPLHWWDEPAGMLAGRDLEGGGTWLGLSRKGRFAALTNYRDPSQRRSGAPSRGGLVRDALAGTADTATTLDTVATGSAAYAGFNLFVGDGRSLGIHESTSGSVRLLPPGIYALSNHLLDSAWPKVERARAAFARALDAMPDETAFIELLRDTTPVPDDSLPNTGVSLEWERKLATAFIPGAAYGTRCSSFLWTDRHGRAGFSEWSWDGDGELLGRADQTFVLER